MNKRVEQTLNRHQSPGTFALNRKSNLLRMNPGTAASGYDAEEIQKAGYSDWRQVAGYYDGDGGEELKIGKFVTRFAITWTDTYLQQLQHIQTFLISEKLAPSRIKLGSSTIGRKAWHLSLWEKGGMLEACQEDVAFSWIRKEFRSRHC